MYNAIKPLNQPQDINIILGFLTKNVNEVLLECKEASYVELDKLRAIVPCGCYTMNQPLERYKIYSYPHCRLQLINDSNDLSFEISGKPFSSEIDLGSIRLDNYMDISDILHKLTDVSIDTDYLYNEAIIRRVDAKKDVLLSKPTNSYIADIRRIARRKSDKYSVEKYPNMKYSDGLVIRQKKGKPFYLGVYNKGIELLKARNKEYRSQFSEDFLYMAKSVLRVERQISTFDGMREAFGIKNDGTHPRLKDILNSSRCVVAEALEKVIGDVNSEIR